MAYTIRYGPKRPSKNRRLFLLSAFFFLLFLLTANYIFPTQILALQDLIVSQFFQDAVSAFCQGLLEEVGSYGN